MARRFRVGRSCDSYCTKCKSVTLHTIIAMIESRPKRVKCDLCSGQHNYRLPPGPGSPRKTTRKKPATKKRAGSWKTMMESRDADTGTPYSISTEFSADELVSHPSFGSGIVRQVLPGKKIEVVFEDGNRLLAHDR